MYLEILFAAVGFAVALFPINGNDHVLTGVMVYAMLCVGHFTYSKWKLLQLRRASAQANDAQQKGRKGKAKRGRPRGKAQVGDGATSEQGRKGVRKRDGDSVPNRGAAKVAGGNGKRRKKGIAPKIGFTPFLLLLALSLGSCKDASRWISSYGYSPIQPASTLMQPGAMIMKKKFGGAKAVRIVCDAPNSFGGAFKPSQSKTVTGKFSRSRKVGWHVDADALQQIHVANKSDAIAEVYVEVLNARVVTLNDADVLQNIGNRSRACQAAIAWRQSHGYDVSLISSALIADVSYSVKFQKDASLDATAKVAQLEQVALTLGGNIEAVTENAAKATGLVWGVQDSMFLAAIGVEKAMPLTEAEAKALRRKSMLSPQEALTPSGPATPSLPVGDGADGAHCEAAGATQAYDSLAEPGTPPETPSEDVSAPPGQGLPADIGEGDPEPVQDDSGAYGEPVPRPAPRSPRSRL